LPVKHLCVGSLVLDDTVYADGRTKMAVPGGNALYAAAGAGIWSGQVGLVAVVGYDWPVEYTDTLSRSTIDISGLISKEAETMRAWVIYEHSGYRRYFSRNTELVLLTPSPYATLTAEDAAAYSAVARRVHLRSSPLPQELPAHLWHVDSIHLCPMRLETIVAWTDYLQDKPDIFVSVDILPYPLNGNLDDSDLLKILGRVDAFLPSELEAETLLPGCDAETFCREIAARGPKIVGLKQGQDGAAWYDRNRDFFGRLLPYPAQVNDLTGAGDSFCGGFAIGLLETGDARQAALYGTVSASFIIEEFGSLHALNLKRAQAEQRLADLQQTNSRGSM
jgi:ribokinase